MFFSFHGFIGLKGNMVDWFPKNFLKMYFQNGRKSEEVTRGHDTIRTLDDDQDVLDNCTSYFSWKGFQTTN
jgi:hypothetical protein